MLDPTGLDNHFDRSTGAACLGNFATEDVALVEGAAYVCRESGGGQEPGGAKIEGRGVFADSLGRGVRCACGGRGGLPLLQDTLGVEIDASVDLLPDAYDELV